MLLGIDNDFDTSMASVSLFLSQAMPLYLGKTATDKVLPGVLLGWSNLEAPAESEAWGS